VKHLLWFGHGITEINGPICRTCGLELTLEKWLANNECLGSPDEQRARAIATFLQVIG
jgi:hypothetical protein